jgi:hypothetical protein
MVNLTRSMLWFKFNELMCCLYNIHIIICVIISSIQYFIVFLTLPIYIATFYTLSKFNFIDDFITYELFSYLYFKGVRIFSKYKKTKRTPTIIFINPYIKFVNYSKDYNWFKELICPQSSPFVKTINRDIYKTWNGEALINYKWNNYGKYYYAIIWILYILLLGCFTVAATIPHIDDVTRNKLLVTSVILGFIHLSFEV